MDIWNAKWSRSCGARRRRDHTARNNKNLALICKKVSDMAMLSGVKGRVTLLFARIHQCKDITVSIRLQHPTSIQGRNTSTADIAKINARACLTLTWR